MTDRGGLHPSRPPQAPCSTWPPKSSTVGRGATGSRRISGPWAAPSSRWPRANRPSTSWAAPRRRCLRYPRVGGAEGGDTGGLPSPEVPSAGWPVPVQPVPQVGMFKAHPEVPGSMSDEAKAFILRCFEADPAKRATASALLHDPFLAGARRASSQRAPTVRGEQGGGRGVPARLPADLPPLHPLPGRRFAPLGAPRWGHSGDRRRRGMCCHAGGWGGGHSGQHPPPTPPR